MRILLIAPLNPGPRRGSFFYRIQNTFANGFTRNGHFVLAFDERPYVKWSMGSRAIGERLVHARIIETARELRPDLICLHKSVLTGVRTLHEIRELQPRCRVAVVWHDSIVDKGAATRFGELLESADFGFATTGGSALAAFTPKCPVAFIPNPIDLSVNNVTAYATPEKNADVFCALRSTGRAARFDLIDQLQALKPHLRYAIYGRNNQNLLYGDAYFRAIDGAKVGLNISKYEGGLYASHRMAQYLGNGLLVATYRRSGYTDYFDDEEMIFFDTAADLAERIEDAISDDKRWRLMAERGRAKAISLMNEARVADFVVRMTLGLGVPKDWPFSDHIFLQSAKATSTKLSLSDDEATHPVTSLG
jgi:Glycosyl transferases group 1